MIKDLYRFFSNKFQNVFLDYPVQMQPRYSTGKPHRLLFETINDQRSIYAERINDFATYFEDLAVIPFQPDSANKDLPNWINGFLPGMDIAVLYGMISTVKPRKYVEVGSGNSTKVVHLAKQNHSPETEIISIDPMPRAEIDRLADKVVRKPFESVDLEMITQLEPGDILFIDNSHRILPNSDCMVFFMEILPQLKKGVIVHIHDIYLPYDYPQFMCDRAYSEQYGLAAFLLANPNKYMTYFPNYFVSEDNDLKKGFENLWKMSGMDQVERHGGSFWLQIAQ